jgi:hypothetical protein
MKASKEKFAAQHSKKQKRNVLDSRSWRPTISKTIRDSTAVLIQTRGLIAEFVFTVAALYGLYHALILLTR